ncbi:hypothetical protein OG403_35795 [Kitasatospora sp. NBC_01266]
MWLNNQKARKDKLTAEQIERLQRTALTGVVRGAATALGTVLVAHHTAARPELKFPPDLGQRVLTLRG